MEQHSIPQQISSYQFRLVGDMTLKQFFQVAGGALFSLLLYSSNLHPIIKWPLILLSFGLGAALAFLPFEERPLEKWIFAFFRSIYSPTAFFWQKREKASVYFQEEAIAPTETGTAAPHGEVVMEEYLKSLPETKLKFLQNLESTEQSILSKITTLISSSVSYIKYSTQPSPTLPPKLPIEPEKPVKKMQVNIPDMPTSVASKGFRPKIIIEEKPLRVEEKGKTIQMTEVAPMFAKTQGSAAASAQFSLAAAPPNPPTIPNTIVGQVLDPDGKIIESAILEIRDLAGRPVRALRSNKVGHFMIVTALPDGQYELITEKEGFVFAPASFEARGEIIPPVAIKAKSRVSPELRAGDTNEQKSWEPVSTFIKNPSIY